MSGTVTINPEGKLKLKCPDRAKTWGRDDLMTGRIGKMTWAATDRGADLAVRLDLGEMSLAGNIKSGRGTPPKVSP